METSQNEALFRRFFYIERRKGRQKRRDPSNSYLSLSRILLHTNLLSKRQKNATETTSFYLLGRGRGRDTRPSAATLDNDDDDDNDDDARRRESVFVEVVDATMEEDDDGDDGSCNYYIQW